MGRALRCAVRTLSRVPRALEVLELSRPGETIPRGQRDRVRDHGLGRLDVVGDRLVRHVDEHDAHELAVLLADHRWPGLEVDVGHLRDRRLAVGRGHQHAAERVATSSRKSRA